MNADAHRDAETCHVRVNTPCRIPRAGARAWARFEMHQQHVTDRAAVDEALRVDEARHEAVVKIDAEPHPRLFAFFYDAPGVGDAGRHGLVAEHMLAGARRGNCLFRVQRVRRVYCNHAHVGVFKHILEARIGALSPELFRERIGTRGIAAHHGDELVSRERVYSGQHAIVGYAPGPDEPPTIRLRHAREFISRPSRQGTRIALRRQPRIRGYSTDIHKRSNTMANLEGSGQKRSMVTGMFRDRDSAERAYQSARRISRLGHSGRAHQAL